MKLDLRLKIVFVGVAGFVILATMLNVLSQREARDQAFKLYVDKAQSVVLAAEAARENMADKWDMGLFSKEMLQEWARQGETEKVVAAVPVVSAWKTTMAKSAEGGYTFRVPKFEPRNPKNLPDELEAEVLRKFESEGMESYVHFDKDNNSIRYFKPIRLTAECLLCHGNPADSKEIWGNSDGLDATGSRMENWKVGEIHGAFEVIQSLDQVDAILRANLYRKIAMTVVLLLAGSGLFYFVVTRLVVLPVRRVIVELGMNSMEVSSSSEHVAQSSTQMAEGAIQQASSLQEISATLHEVTSVTRQNASRAEDVYGRSNEAAQAAETGRQTMERMGAAIGRIKNSADQTASIIKTIDEIAFQTNLLALNAAVEAARAGEAGKGFAVVAEEVRNLAQRSAEAARNTNILLEESANSANQGVVVAREVSAILQDIGEKVSTVGTLTNQVRESNVAQANQITEISESVASVDGVTQGNAASAEESAAASEQLSAQAGILNGLVLSLQEVVDGRPSAGSPRASAGPGSGQRFAPQRHRHAAAAAATARKFGAVDYDDAESELLEI